MKQILQSLKDGTTSVVDVPAPRPERGQLLIRTRTSLVSAGTERMLVEFGKANWFERARRQPDKVRMVLDKIRTDGVAAAWQAVQSKLEQPLALGYCNVGVVAELGAGTTGFEVGDRVASNGGHAELVCVPQRLCARIPDGVSDEQASFTVLGAIALQGIRLAAPTLGECVVVTGLGLIGLLTLQILRAHGCRVMGVDPDASRRALAQQLGAERTATGDDVPASAAAFSRGRGVDAVLITASTSSNEPVRQAADMCRKRGRIVLVGIAGLQLSRADFYAKELSFQVSCSYGPGRYDAEYEVQGHDYPVGFVRWTQQRNFEAVLDLLAAGRIDVSPLISHRFSLLHAQEAYELLASEEASLGLLIEYPEAIGAQAPMPVQTIAVADVRAESHASGYTFIGAGNYAAGTLIPAFVAAGAPMIAVVSRGGVSAAHVARRFGFTHASTDGAASIVDERSNAVVIATRHDLHASQVLAALSAGKHVFCEKPLCLTHEELARIETQARSRPAQRLMVGFNRRFAPLVGRMSELLSTITQPKTFVMTVNAGQVPADHWTIDRDIGGGRIVGECCHFIDLIRHLARAPIERFDAAAPRRRSAQARTGDDLPVMLELEFADGSTGVIHYLTNGHKRFPKERLEVFCAGRVLQLDNFRRLRGWGWKPFASTWSWRQDKGNTACVAAFVDSVKRGTPAPIPLDELLEVSRVSIELQRLADA